MCLLTVSQPTIQRRANVIDWEEHWFGSVNLTSQNLTVFEGLDSHNIRKAVLSTRHKLLWGCKEGEIVPR